MQNGIAIHMLTKKKYPLSQEMISKMLKKKLEVDHESSQAFKLLRFIRSQVKELILLMVKAADLEISMHGDYYGMLVDPQGFEGNLKMEVYLIPADSQDS
ncbi:hypothetical protein Tco_0316820 [Tanacetum coccineum]